MSSTWRRRTRGARPRRSRSASAVSATIGLAPSSICDQQDALTAAPDHLIADRPLLRGMLHGAAFVASCVIGILFVLAAPANRLLPALAFAVSATVMLGTSTVYHRVRWKRTGAR